MMTSIISFYLGPQAGLCPPMHPCY